MSSKNRVSLIGSLLSIVLAASNFGCGGGQSAPPPISVTLTPSATQKVDQGQSVSFTATLTNDPSSKGVNWSVSGTGCAGAACGSLSSETTMSATYTAPGAVTANLSVTVTATSVADITKSASDSVTVVPPPKVTTTSLPGGTAGSAYNATLQESGGIAPFTWSLASGSSLPAGLSLNNDGTISGTPTAGVTSNFTVQVTDSGNPSLTATANLSITVVVLPVSITTTSLPDGTVDTDYKQPLQATGGLPPYTWTITSGSLPWAALNPNGTVNGIPGAAGISNFTVQVRDSEVQPLTATQPLSITVTPGSSPNVSELKGHYAFLFGGFDDATGSQVAVAGSFTADGAGNLTNGVEDLNGPAGPTLNVSFTGTYNIGSNNQGAFTINTASGAKTFDIVLGSVSSGVAHKARFVKFDDTTGVGGQRGSGIMRLQDTTAFTLGTITGPYAFGFIGQNASGNRNGIIGSFAADGAGSIPSGEADQSIAGTATNPSLAGTYTAPSSTNGRGTLTLTPSGASSIDLSVYVVSANELLGVSTDAFSSAGVVSGTILSQTSTSFSNSSLNAPAVYYEGGNNSPTSTTISNVEIGLLAPDGNGNLTDTFDGNNDGSLTTDSTFTTTYSAAANGRVPISNFYGNSASPLRVLYLVDLNKAFFLDTGGAVGFGFLEPQSPAPSGGFTNASLSGTFPANTVAPTVSPNPNAAGLGTTNGVGSFTETADFSTTAGVDVGQVSTGTYSIATNGRGVVTSLSTTATLGPWMLVTLVAGAALLFLSRRQPHPALRPAFRRAFASISFAGVLFGLATGPVCCPGKPCPPVNQLVFYMVSPTKFVLIHQENGTNADTTPVVTIFEQ